MTHRFRLPSQKAGEVDGTGGFVRRWRWLAVGCMALGVANCGGPGLTGRNGSELRYGVRSSPRVIPEGQPIPKGGGREMVGQPYVVGGRTYVPRSGHGYDREGWASWYGSAFHGRLTANGEIFDREAVLAAHPTLPLPSYVRVTNVVNHRSMIVRVNDRGPYEQGRLIDVSERVAEALDFRRRGTTRVRVQYIGRAPLAGSDDTKLLASLRTDEVPAPSGGRAPTLVAGLELPAARPAAADPPKRPQRMPLPEYVEAAEPSPKRDATRRASPSRPVRSAAAEAPPERPLDLRPPRQADIDDGIYFAEPRQADERPFGPASRSRSLPLRAPREP